MYIRIKFVNIWVSTYLKGINERKSESSDHQSSISGPGQHETYKPAIRVRHGQKKNFP